MVIGAGQAGLSASYHLSRLGVSHVVLERGRVAETWRSARWDSFCLNTPNWCTRLPGMDPLSPPDSFGSRADIIATLSDYGERIAAPIHRAEVTQLRVHNRVFQVTLPDDVLRAAADASAGSRWQSR